MLPIIHLLLSAAPVIPTQDIVKGGGGAPSNPSSELHVRVDQFGYRRFDPKVAVLREPLVGYDAPAAYSPGGTIEVRRAGDSAVVFSGPPVAWASGQVHGTSGDRCWWFDFSALTQAGSYFVYDPQSGRGSEIFDIRRHVYRSVARHALRMFTHQRCGTPKAAPSIHARWNDGACHLGTEQDLDCRPVWAHWDITQARDLSGGWHDAGDYNKYVNFADEALHGLLDAYEIAPHAWSDDLNIPESGNGVSDLLDEVRWELEWLLKMQLTDGSVLHKVSVTDWTAKSPPSSDDPPRRYAPPTASATISTCGAFAHGALVFQSQTDPGAHAFGLQLQAAALRAWLWLDANPGLVPSHYDNLGFLSAICEDSEYHQEMNRVRAAAYLFELTRDANYKAWVDQRHDSAHMFEWNWVSPWEETAETGLLRYALTPGATRAVRDAILNQYSLVVSGTQHLGQWQAAADPYRAYLSDQDHTWGSNRSKCLQGEILARMLRMGLDAAHHDEYRAAAQGALNYIHGVNPPGYCYLTNMNAHGAGKSVRETYHAWFRDGSIWDRADEPYGPPPGYLVGGPNPHFQPDGSYNGPPLVPPMGQPILKSFLDWNTTWPENSWEVTECHIPYQAAYLRLLANFL